MDTKTSLATRHLSKLHFVVEFTALNRATDLIKQCWLYFIKKEQDLCGPYNLKNFYDCCPVKQIIVASNLATAANKAQSNYLPNLKSILVTSPFTLNEIDLQVLSAIEPNQGLKQPQLTQVLEVSLGKAHYSIKTLIDNGLVKAGNFSLNLKMLDYADPLTPSGMKSKTMLTAHFLERKAAEHIMLKSELEKYENDIKQIEQSNKKALSDCYSTELVGKVSNEGSICKAKAGSGAEH